VRSKREIEIKLRIASPRAAHRLLKAAGFHVRRRRVFEDNLILDTAGLTLRSHGCLLRVRTAGGASALTFKGPSVAGRHKSREELEISISESRTALSIFKKLGYRPTFRYQKFRAEYAERGADGVVTVDETPIGCFLEIEGAPRWIDRTARRLGFGESDYIKASYGVLYLQFCEDRGIKPRDMVFPRRAT
jgi:adenylate cyclase, class 2